MFLQNTDLPEDPDDPHVDPDCQDNAADTDVEDEDYDDDDDDGDDHDDVVASSSQ